MTKEESAMTVAFIQVNAALGAPRDKTVSLLMKNMEKPQRPDDRLLYESAYDVAAASSPERKREILFGSKEEMEKFILKRTKELAKELAEEAAEMEEEEAENGQS